MFKEIFRNAGQAIRLKEVLEPQSNASYFKALRVAVSEKFNIPVGKVIPIENEDNLKRKIGMANRTQRPYLLAERESDSKQFLLLIDTYKK